MLSKRFFPLSLVAIVWAAAAQAQTFEITRELGVPEHHYLNNPPFFTSSNDVLPFPATPNVQFAISSFSTVGLRLVAPAGMKFVASKAVYLSWPSPAQFAQRPELAGARISFRICTPCADSRRKA
jgi:hypothetical protein